MVTSNKSRSAFTMIELIFAIVIIAITVASIPIMTNAIGKGVENNLVQETVFAASAEMNQVLSYRWDENSIDESVDINATGVSYVINRSGTGTCDADKLKTGHIAQPLHRRCLDNNSTRVSATFGSDTNDTINDDIDDFNGVSGDLFTGNTSADAYKDAFIYTVSVTPSNFDGNLTYTDAAKKVTVSVYTKDSSGNQDEKVSELSAYTFNIGEVEYYKRTYP